MRLSTRPFPLERLSATSLSLFATCPEQFRQKYLLQRPDVNFGDRFMGSVNHKTIERILREKMDGWDGADYGSEERIRNHVRDIYRGTWEWQLNEDGEPDWQDVDPVEQYARGLLMALCYVEQAVPSITPLAVEERIEVKIPHLPQIVGFVDVVEADKLRERKTTRAKETKPKSTWRFQARIYQFITGMPVEWDVLTRQVEPKLYTAAEYPALRMDLVSRENTLTLIRDLYWRMEDLWQRRGVEMVWPMDGFHAPWACSYCAIGPKYASTCGAWS